jgi:hypothetical protein
MVFDATFNNISAISWRPVLLVEETGVAGENHQPVCKGYSLSHNVVSSTPCLSRVRTRVGKKPVNTGPVVNTGFNRSILVDWSKSQMGLCKLIPKRVFLVGISIFNF